MTSSGKNYKYTFDKLVRPEAGRKLIDNIQRIYDADFSVIVYNFLTSSRMPAPKRTSSANSPRTKPRSARSPVRGSNTPTC